MSESAAMVSQVWKTHC